MSLQYLHEIAQNCHYRDGYAIATALREFCEGTTVPFFAWAHLMDVHGPYNRFVEAKFGQEIAPRQLQLLFRRAKYLPSTISGEERQLLLDHYDNGIRYVDGVIESIFDSLEEAGLLQNTRIILVSDHGESFGENGAYEHKRHLGSELLHVPLFVWGTHHSGQYSDPVSAIDCFATTAEWGGIDERRASTSLFAESQHTSIHASCLNFFRREAKTITCD